MNLARQLRRRRAWLIIYAMLLLVSYGWRKWMVEPPPPQKHQQVVEISETVRIAYRDHSPTPTSHRFPLVMVHGSLAPSSSFNDMIEAFGATYRILTPDLPGFGASTPKIPNYSIQSQAAYLLQFLDKLGINQVHLLGYGRGGGVAIHLADLAPERVVSLIHLSAIGVQAYELLSDYYLNHGLYALQLGMVWAIQEGIPHFGALNGLRFNPAFARILLDSDLRPLRNLLLQYEGPMLILHGKDDLFTPVDAAREHARLVPQSALVMTPSGHLGPAPLLPTAIQSIQTFTHQVESGKAPTRSTASPERLAASKRPANPDDIFKPRGTLLFIILFLLAMATITSEDLTCITAGIMAGNGNLTFWSATLACMFGIIFWDLILFLIGKKVGRPLLKHRWFRWIMSPEDLTRAEKWFEAKGVHVIIASRFMPGTRLPTFLAAGISGMKTSTFTLYFTIASALWTPLLVGLAAVLGKRTQTYLEHYSDYAIWILLAFILLLIGLKKIILPLFNYRGRRLLRSAWHRKTHCEFWPRWVLKLPVRLYTFRLGLKYRSFTLYQDCNPIQPEETDPILSEQWMTQEWAPGKEFRICYCRYPDETQGKILNITEKVFPSVIGDGQHSLEHLILENEQTIGHAPAYLKTHAAHLYDIPEAGREIQLVEIGSHSKSVLFKDGSAWNTPALGERLDEIFQACPGFHFGNIDIRTSDSGEHFKIIKLNDPTSETTYPAAFRNCRIAFEIGAKNRKVKK